MQLLFQGRPMICTVLVTWVGAYIDHMSRRYCGCFWFPRRCGQVWGTDCQRLVWGPAWTHQHDSSHGPGTLWRSRKTPQWDTKLATLLRSYWYDRSWAFQLCWERSHTGTSK